MNRILQVYSLEEILEFNNLTEEDVLLILIDHEYITIPETLDFDD